MTNLGIAKALAAELRAAADQLDPKGPANPPTADEFAKSVSLALNLYAHRIWGNKELFTVSKMTEIATEVAQRLGIVQK